MRHLLLFGKLPRLGRVKTRLVPPLSPTQALRLYRAFLDDQLALLRGFEGWARVAWWADAEPRPDERDALPLEGIDLRLQIPGELGTRMLHAFERTCGRVSGATVIVGADCPTLPPAHVRLAFEALEEGAPAVLAPAADGGYVLIGMTEPRPELFDDIPWGGTDVAQATRRRAEQAGIDLLEIEPWYDVDELDSLRRLRYDLARSPGSSRAPATTRALLDPGLASVL